VDRGARKREQRNADESRDDQAHQDQMRTAFGHFVPI
jgi:hypothetical protein